MIPKLWHTHNNNNNKNNSDVISLQETRILKRVTRIFITQQCIH